MRRSLKRNLVVGVPLGALLGVLLLIMVGLMFRGPKAYSWILPDDYSGWVRVEFGVPGQPALPIEDGYRVLHVPSSGVIRTSDTLITSPSRECFWVEQKSGRRKAPAPISGFTMEESNSTEGYVILFNFFGSEQQLEEKGRLRDAKGSPIPGRIEHGRSGPMR